MARSKSSHRWLKEHFNDPWVRKAQAEGMRSRAAYKLAWMQQRDRLIKPGMRLVDLGAAPGGWSQLAAGWVGRKGQVVALDILPMEPLPGVTFLQGDFREEDALEALRATLDNQRVDLVLSDMAPNISGIREVDQPAAMYLAELALSLAQEVLRPGGGLLVKVFQGEGFDAFLKALRVDFGRVVTRKPEASRARSREVYLLARNYGV